MSAINVFLFLIFFACDDKEALFESALRAHARGGSRRLCSGAREAMCSFVYKNSEVVCMFTMRRVTGYTPKAHRDVDTVFFVFFIRSCAGRWFV